MRKVTMQNIADDLSISRVTVWKVLSNRGGVSESLRTKILAKAKELNYIKANDLALNVALNCNQPSITFSVVISDSDTSPLYMKLIHEIAKELTLHNINLLYTYLPTVIPENYTLPNALMNGDTDGVIILNITNLTLLAQLNRLSLIKIFANSIPALPIDQISGDCIFLSSHSAETIYSLEQFPNCINLCKKSFPNAIQNSKIVMETPILVSIGKKLANQLLYRYNNPQAPVELTYLHY